MYDPAKGIVKYLSMLMLGATVYMGHCDPSCAKPARAEPKSTYCTAEQKKDIDSLDIKVSRSRQALSLDATTKKQESCTLLEQRVIIGRGYRTPKIDSYITHAFINPRWTPTWSILQELKAKYSRAHMRKVFYHADGTYMKPGPDNPLGRVKFMFDSRGYFRLHGTSDDKRHLFKKKDRKLSHGCIRAQDEVALLKTINDYTGNKEDCDSKCIDSALRSGRTRELNFKKKIKIKVIR